MHSLWKEPTLSELLEDPLIILLMTRDGVARSDIETLMAAMQDRSIDHNQRSEFPCLQVSAIADSALAACP